MVPPQAGPTKLDAILDAAADAFDAGDLDAVLSLAGRAMALQPRSAEALHFKAAALAEKGELQAADAAYRGACQISPDDLELLLGYADFQISSMGDDRERVEAGLSLCDRGRKLARRRGDEEMLFELTLLSGIGHNQLGLGERALERLDEALSLSPDSAEARLERGLALFELCRFDEAQRELSKVAQGGAEDAWAHHYLGLIAEREGDGREAKRRFAKAHALAPEEFPEPVRLSEEEFDRAVEDAVARLPQEVKRYLENTTIAVEPLPSDEDLTGEDPPLSPCILGVFRGLPVGARSVTSSHDHFPASIVLYQRNLERFARTRDELIEQIGITVMHEVGHLIGLDEEDLWERGLD